MNRVLFFAQRWVFLLASAILLVFPPWQFGSAVAEEAGDATVFIYHHFGDPRYPTTNVGMEEFTAQVEYLVENDYRVITLSQLVDILASRGGKTLPPRTVVITIDDGYRTTYTRAWPVLRKYGLPCTVFLYLEGIERGYSNYLTWEQVREMRDAGVDFQDHTYHHLRLADWPEGLDEAGYRNHLRQELEKGRELFTARLGLPPRFLALPYGEYNSHVLQVAKETGYEAVLTQDGGSVSPWTPLDLIPREPILGRDWSTLSHFKTVLERVDLPLSDLTPGIEPLREPIPPRFGARLLFPDRYRQESFGIYVSEHGWRKAERRGDRVEVDNHLPLTRRANRVMISAREKDTGRTAVRFWLLVKP